MFGRTAILAALVFTYLFSASKAARILAVFPIPSISHQVVFRPLTLELAKRGHEVIILTPDPAFKEGDTPYNITEIDVHDISYKIWEEALVNNMDGNSNSFSNVLKNLIKKTSDIFEKQMNVKEMRAILEGNKDFDLVLIESCVRIAVSLSYVIKAPFIQISSLNAIPPNNDIIGVPSHPLFYPEYFIKSVNNLSLWEKFLVVYAHFYYHYMMWTLEEYDNQLIKKMFGPEAPELKDLYNNVDMLFLNVNPLWDRNRPVPPGVIYMGGLQIKEDSEILLPKDLQTYMDASKHGIIYFSLGSNVKPSLLPKKKIQVFCRIFSQLPYDIIWKWDQDDIPGKPENVKLHKWLPQADLLRHPKVKLFITQAGLQSTDEALSAGVPLLALPILGDQWMNAEKYENYQIGIKLDIETLTEDLLKTSINSLIENPSYRSNVLRLRKIMLDQPQRPIERTMWWIEYVLRNKGAKYLRAPTANISWADFLMLDVLAAIMMFLIAVLSVFVYVCSVIKKKIKSLFRKQKRKLN